MIRNARIYKAELPYDHRHTAEALAKLPYRALEPGQVKAQGFVPHPTPGELLAPFPGGYAFVLRTDERIIPPSVVTAELDAIEADRRRDGLPRMGRQEKAETREQVIFELAKTALHKTRLTFAYYLTGPQYLIVDTASRKPADELTGRLVQVLEALKTTTLHVSDVARGLSAKLTDHLAPAADDDFGFDPPFGPFELGDTLKLRRTGETAETVTYAGLELTSQAGEILDQIRHGFRAIELRLEHAGTGFKLCDDFSLKGFRFPDTELSPEDEEAAQEDRMVTWLADVQLETAAIAAIVDALVALLENKEPEQGEEAA